MKTKMKKIIVLVPFLSIAALLFLITFKNHAKAQVMFGQEGSQFMIRKKVPIGTITPTPNLKVELSGEYRGRMRLGYVSAPQIIPGAFGACCDANPSLGGIQPFDFNFPGKMILGGNASPTKSLEIESGNMRINGNMYGVLQPPQIKFMDTSGNPKLVKAGSLSVMSNYANPSASAGDVYVEGNVGIGTANPQFKLDVDGQIKTSNGFCIAGICKNLWSQVAGLPPTGVTHGQTLRYDGTQWAAVSNLYNDGTNVGVNITPTPNAKLQVGGTLKAQNHLTSAGYPVNDVLFPQDIWNYSANSLKGSTMIDVLNWQQKTGSTVFESAFTTNIVATSLSNENVMIAYKDNGNSSYGTFVIHDSAGNQIKAPTVFASAVTAPYDATTLTNGNAMIVYFNQVNGYGSFVIYDSAGNQIKAPTVFSANHLINGTYVTALTNGNAMIVYTDQNNTNSATFVIYDSAGNQIKAPTVFAGPNAYVASIDTLSNGNAIIVYRDDNNSGYGTFVIYDSAGNQIKAPTVFESAATSYMSATTLANSNVLIAYRDDGNSNYGTFVIYDSAGNQVKSPTVFESAQSNYISATSLTNGNVLIAYEDVGNSNYGTLVVYDSAGNQTQAPTVFAYTNETGFITATTLTNGNVLIAYADTANSLGKFIIWRGSGTNFSQDLFVSGNLGIGTTSPAAKVAVVGDYTAGEHVPGQVHIEGSTGNHAVINIKAASSSYLSRLELSNNTNNYKWAISSRNLVDALNNRLSFNYYNGATWNNYVAIAPSGTSIGIGFTDPTIYANTAFKIFQQNTDADTRSSTKIGDMYINHVGGGFLSFSTNSAFEGGAWVTKNSNPSWLTKYNYDFWAGQSFDYYYAAAPAVVGNPPAFTKIASFYLDTNTLALGNESCFYGSNLDVCGSLYFSGSSLKFKQDITPLEIDTNLIYKLNPVSFDFKDDYTHYGKKIGGGRQFGLIAEEVYKTIPELSVSNGKEIRNVDYEKISILLLAELKKNKAEIENILQETEELRGKISDYRNRLEVIRWKKTNKI
jgi:hypothetical protein